MGRNTCGQNFLRFGQISGGGFYNRAQNQKKNQDPGHQDQWSLKILI